MEQESRGRGQVYILPGSVASIGILSLDSEFSTANRKGKKMREKHTCLNRPSCPEPKETAVWSHFLPGSLRTAVVLLFCLVPYYGEQREIVAPQKLLISRECSVELISVAFNHIKWEEVTKIFADNPDFLSGRGYL